MTLTVVVASVWCDPGGGDAATGGSPILLLGWIKKHVIPHEGQCGNPSAGS